MNFAHAGGHRNHKSLILLGVQVEQRRSFSKYHWRTIAREVQRMARMASLGLA